MKMQTQSQNQRDAVGYLKAEDEKYEMPTLFDLMEGM